VARGDLALLALLLQHLLQGAGFLRLQSASLVRPIGQPAPHRKRQHDGLQAGPTESRFIPFLRR